MWRRISLRAVRAWADQTASTDEGRAKPELLMGTYQKFVAASVGEIQCWPYKNLNAYGLERVKLK